MDYPSRATSPPAAHAVPPIPRQTHQESRRKAIDPSMHLRLDRTDDSSQVGIPPASPEIISSLITSLDVISKRASNHFETHGLSGPNSVANSPKTGSFGIEYGNFPHSPLDRLQEEDVDADELAASPPTIRTSKPPSGLSPITAPKPSKSSLREGTASLRSFLRTSSRPSSRGSTSSHDDAQSIGNLSIERGLAPAPELCRRGSSDSWGKKSRNHKGLMYMSSKERIRVTEAEKKRASGGAASTRTNSLLVEAPIDEEELPYKGKTLTMSPSSDPGNLHGGIPARDSSLRKTGANARRSSHRSSHARRDSDVILETDEDGRSRELSSPKRRHPNRTKSEPDSRKRGEDILAADMANLPAPNASSWTRWQEDRSTKEDLAVQPGGLDEDGAPFPSIYSTKRRSARSTDRMKSGRTTPDPVDMIRTKRSSSRLKRLSKDAKTPEPAEKKKESGTPEPMVGYERPGSADSVDDAVESYLCSPRLSQKIRHPTTGRVISFSEVGDSEGSAVFCCVGMGLTRYITAFYDELALTLKLRLITPDRPGVGDSEPYADGTSTPLSWPDDVYAICQALKITKFSIMAHSAGAIYALATALRMPQHIRGRIHLLAPWIPPSQMNTFGTSQALPPSNAIPTSQRILRALPTPFLKAANSSFMLATSSSISSSLPKDKSRRNKRKSIANHGRDSAATTRRDNAAGLDKENMKQDPHDRFSMYPPEGMDQLRGNGVGNDSCNDVLDPEQAAIVAAAADALVDKERQVTYDTRLTHAIWDLATTGANPAVDLLVCLERRHTIGFRYVDITRPVVIHHGTRDTRVPVDNVRWLGKAMRRCEVRVLEGEGHGLMASASVMGNVLMEISKEWDDWNRATKNGKSGDGEKEWSRERGRSISRMGFR
ncbi:hypothetical protein DL764_006565 [Monosporascus ibericus]|uniref:AB hydrolase-1 domain-containing protein n=1 Tax=Monosporascus ibericus TaxID=155417 RepID=A0A4Q4T4D5_9PEZI|nr:hypothetical protein DL764_006565 [Monosporascus ibericus]